MRVRFAIVLFMLAAVIFSAVGAFAVDENDLRDAFKGAQVVDLRTSNVSSVVKLRDVVKIPPPSDPVYVKTFTRATLPDVLLPAFPKPEIVGVTISKRYVAILQTEFKDEYQDTLAHELVHAYISLASPNGLSDDKNYMHYFAFQEASAVYFSIDKERKFYGKPSDKEIGVMVGKTVQISDVYKQKLHYFHYMIDKVGEKKFYEWYRNAVITGTINERALLGLKPIAKTTPHEAKRPFPVWLGALIGVVVVVVAGIGFYSAWQNSEES